ncbi:MAG TPA: hypothetical protein VMV54_02740, partial [Acidocella sp.]|nr:hypothetical protein [Acidocella sp.]
MRILGKATWLVGPCVAGFLSGCAMMPSQKPVASVAPMPADVVLRQAEIQAYKEGFEAGQQVQR